MFYFCHVSYYCFFFFIRFAVRIDGLALYFEIEWIQMCLQVLCCQLVCVQEWCSHFFVFLYFSVYKNEVSHLRNEVAHLKQLLLAHKNCPVTNLQKKAVYLGEWSSRWGFHLRLQDLTFIYWCLSGEEHMKEMSEPTGSPAPVIQHSSLAPSPSSAVGPNGLNSRAAAEAVAMSVLAGMGSHRGEIGGPSHVIMATQSHPSSRWWEQVTVCLGPSASRERGSDLREGSLVPSHAITLWPGAQLHSGNETGTMYTYRERQKEIVVHYAIDYGGWTPNHALICILCNSCSFLQLPPAPPLAVGLQSTSCH